ncbi:MAG: hypothetical protein AAB554_04070 [Patescibacteria group bacterium]
MGKLARKRFESRHRRGERYSDIGRKFEAEVEGILQKMQDEKLIVDFVRHAPNSGEDRDGRDFTVTAPAAGAPAERSFGVTISLRSWQDSKILHPDVPQFCFPIGTKPETIRARILELFETR